MTEDLSKKADNEDDELDFSPEEKAASERFNQLFSELCHDADEALKIAKDTGNALSRRAAFRTVFAAIEGITYLLKDQVLVLFPYRRKYYTDAEVALLREETYQLDMNGKAVIRPRFLPMEENFKFALEMYIRGTPVPLEMNLNSDGWAAFKASLKIRHRVTHPRIPEDMKVSESDLSQLELAYRWVHATISKNTARALLGTWDKECRLLQELVPHHMIEKLEVMPEKLDSVLNLDEIQFLIERKLLKKSNGTLVLTSSANRFIKWTREKKEKK